MNRKKTNLGGFESLIASSKDVFKNRMSSVTNGTARSAARFRGKLGSAIAMITSLIVGFLTVPNNILYLIDNKHGTRTRVADPTLSSLRPEQDYAYIHAGIALITLGCLAMVVSIVLSYFAAKSKRKMDNVEGVHRGGTVDSSSTRTVLACLVMMNIELFMAVIAGCMELLYRPLISNEQRLHNMECAIAVFNIIIYALYVATMILTSTVLKGKHEGFSLDCHRDVQDAVPVPSSSVRDYVSRGGNPYSSQSGYM